jgi:hypothetical protein
MVSAFAALALVSSTEAKTLPLARSLVRRTDAPPLPPCTSYTPFVYKGCYAAGSPATLQYNPQLPTGPMTIEMCTATCKVSVDSSCFTRDRSLTRNTVQWVQIRWSSILRGVLLRNDAVHSCPRERLQHRLQRKSRPNLRWQPTLFRLGGHHVSAGRSQHDRLPVHIDGLLRRGN